MDHASATPAPQAGGAATTRKQSLPLVGVVELPPAVQAFRLAFAQLYEWRRRADYDLERPSPTLKEANDLVAKASSAIEDWRHGISKTPFAYLFLSLVALKTDRKPGRQEDST